jgi:hypothetical protein
MLAIVLGINYQINSLGLKKYLEVFYMIKAIGIYEVGQ